MNYIEQNCVLKHNGKSFESGGAVVTPDHIAAYPGKDGRLYAWQGKQLGTYYVISSRPAIFFGRRSWQGSRYYYMRATVDGETYSLRGFGVGMVATGRKLKH